MPKLTVAQYADESMSSDITIETGVAFRVRKTRRGANRQWRYRFTINGRRDELTLPASGSYREHMAADLRVIAEYKDLVRQGINPKRHRHTQYRANQRRQKTFREVALEYLPNYQSQLSSVKQQRAILSELERYAFPIIGDLPIHELRARDVADVLRPLWHQHYAVAKKVRDRISRTCTYAVGADYMMVNPVDQRVLETLLGKTTYKTRSFKATHADDAPALFRALLASDDIYDQAAAFMMVTWSRSKPISHMRADEIRGDVWYCPSTKNGNPYNIPLSRAALMVLENVAVLDRRAEELVFPAKRATYFNENVLISRIRKYSPDKTDTAHGFRATLSTYIHDNFNYGEELIEVCMQHKIKTATQAAYNRGDWLERRRPIMESISDWLLYE